MSSESKSETQKTEEPAVENVAPRPTISLPPGEGEEEIEFALDAEQKLDAGDLTGALASMRKSLFGREPTATELQRLGAVAREARDLELSAVALEDSLKLDSTNPTTHLELARTRLDQKDSAAAEKTAGMAVKLDPRDASAWNVLGRAAMERSNWQKAELALRKAVELEPTQAVMHNNLGLLYVRTRDAERAVDALETAIELYGDETPPFVFNNLGLAYEMQKKLEVARDAFEEALALDPDYARAAVNLARVEAAIEKAIDAETQSQPESLPEVTPVSRTESPASNALATHCIRVQADMCDG
jgi:superkiller protein 3